MGGWGEQRGAWLTELFQSSCSLGQRVRQRACAFSESSISVQPHACAAWARVTFFIQDTHKAKTLLSNVASGQGSLKKSCMESLEGWRLRPQQVPAAVDLMKWRNVSYLGHIHIYAHVYFCMHTHMWYWPYMAIFITMSQQTQVLPLVTVA